MKNFESLIEMRLTKNARKVSKPSPKAGKNDPYKNLHREPVVLSHKPTIRDLLLASADEILDYAARLPGAVSGGTYVWLPSEDPNPMMLVAHVDTVRITPLRPENLVYQRGVFRTTDNLPLGADDRAGVFAVLAIKAHCEAEGLKVPHILLTDGEEKGGIGVSDFIRDEVLDPYAGDITLMLEFDRQGSDEAVTYIGDLPDKAYAYIESWGWQLGHGSFTDISLLIRNYHIPGVNLSVGYYDQHTGSEQLVVRHLESTISTAIEMLMAPLTTKETQSVGADCWYIGPGRGWVDWDSDLDLDSVLEDYEN